MLTEAQIAARKNGIGASESVILFDQIPKGVTYFPRTLYELWMLKTGRIEKENELNDFQWWGHNLEPVIAKRYEYETGEALEFRADTIIHPRLPFMLCHPDRYVIGKRKLIEMKAVTYNQCEWGESGSDHIPPGYIIQCQHQLACTEYDEVALIAFFLNYRNSRIYNIKRDNELIAIIEDRVSDFWNNNVLANIAPELTTVSDYKLRFSRNNETWVEADENALDVIADLKIVRATIKDHEQDENELLKQIYSIIGEASGIKQENKILVTWRCDKNGKRTLRLSEK